MLKTKKFQKRLLALVLSLSMILSNLLLVSAAETQANVNLALDKAVTASAEYSTMPASNLTDSDKDSRWSTEQNATQWAYVDLGSTQEMNYFSIIWESASVFGSSYNIYVSDSTDDWGTPVVATTGNNSATSVETLETAVSGRYVKLEVTGVSGYPSVSARDFTIMYKDNSAQNPNENVALNKAATASSIEADSVRAALAVDGDNSSSSSRWGSNVGSAPHWIYVDLGDVMDVQTVKIFWENRKATAYEIQTAEELSSPMAESDWTTQKAFDARPASIKDTITLDAPVQARYVRLLVTDFTTEDPDGGVPWETVSIYEMEIYGGIPVVEVDPVESISVETPAKGDTKLVVNLPEVEGYEIKYNGTDYEQVVDADLTIYQPIVDTTVKVSFKITEIATGDYEFKEIEVVIPGQYTAAEGDNAAPEILPELREWKGYTGNFTVSETAKIVYANDELAETAKAFAEDYEDMTGKAIQAVKGEAVDGDFYLALTDDTSKGLMEEGYILEIDDKVSVEAYTATGAYWATRTILQALKLGNNETMPKGITRDYPLYEVRGLILDIARKTFKMDFLDEVVKQLSWYKMNDLHVVINNNLIFLEYYTDRGLDPLQAYSGFRLESSIKEGDTVQLGDEGTTFTYQQDLTSKDVFYTKEEFRNYIDRSKVRGVNIVPEIDAPAHALAFTKVLPELRLSETRRENEYLDLETQYDECYDFITNVMDEYMATDLENPAFSEDTVVHVGCDEFFGNYDAFRQYCNDMADYVESTGRTARIWGSLTHAKGSVDENGEQVVKVDGTGIQMNMWNYGYANMDEMYELGFDMINCNDGHYYIVPNAGYYYDYLNPSLAYDLAVNSLGGVTIPAGDPQMIGASYAIWNDMIDVYDNGVSEYDIYTRITSSLGLFAAKLWGKGDMDITEAQSVESFMGDAPSTNFAYEVEADEEGKIAHFTADDIAAMEGENAEVETVDSKEALKLEGGSSYVTTGLDTIGFDNDLRVKVKRTSDSTEDQILFESKYGAIKAVQGETGKVGFTRENYDYSFDYELPVNEWVELEFKNEYEDIHLYVNGVYVDTLGDDETVINNNNQARPLLATCMFPVAKIGSAANAFEGYVADLAIGVEADYVSAMPLVYAVETAEILLAKNDNAELAALVEDAEAVIAKFAPTQEEVDELTNAINAIVEATEYEKADYSRVNAYINLVSGDMSAFTEASVAKVNRVIASIREDLPVENQGIVDGYEAQLAAAISELEVNEKADVSYVDNAGLTASASSYQDGGSAPDKVLDDDTSTMWHSKWSITTMPHWIQLSFTGEAEPVNGITYVPRQTGVNGNVTSYIILGSNDGTNFTTIKEGTLTSSSDAKEITFDTVTYKHIRIQYVEAVNNNGSAAELKLHKANVAADTEGLKVVIDEAKAIENAGYTEESWNALQTTIAEAESLYNTADADAQEVEVMKRTLAAAKVALVLEAAEDPTPVVNPFEDVKESDYFYDAVLWAVAEGVTSGYTPTQFGTGAPCTREQIVTFLWNYAGQPETEATSCTFGDVDTNGYYYKALLWANENGYVSGYNANVFGVGEECTREQIVSILWRYAGTPESEATSCAFADVDANDYYYKALLWAVENSITAGITETKFGVGEECTREQIVTFLYRYDTTAK